MKNKKGPGTSAKLDREKKEENVTKLCGPYLLGGVEENLGSA